MPVPALLDLLGSRLTPSQFVYIALGIAAVAAVHIWAQGPALLDREEALETAQRRAKAKDKRVRVTAGLKSMGARVVMVATGALSPLGLVTVAALAQQGAHLILLVDDLNAPEVEPFVLLLRENSNNENIYAEECDMGDMASITAFAKRWNEGSSQMVGAPGAAMGGSAAGIAAAPGARPTNEHGAQPVNQVYRLDRIVFIPSQQGTYLVGQRMQPARNKYGERHSGACPERTYVREVLGRFHLVNSLLPSLLVLPRDRDIRVVNVVSPWYAAGLALFDAVAKPIGAYDLGRRLLHPWALLGSNALRWLVLTREMQRRLDMLAEADERPRTNLPGIDPDEAPALPKQRSGGSLPQRSSISCISVCPGFERTSQLTAFLGVVHPWKQNMLHSALLVIALVFLYPLFWLLGKSTARAAEAVLWATTARIETEHSMLSRLALEERMRAAQSDEKRPPSKHADALASIDVDEASMAKQWQGIRPGALYREGRLVRPPLPGKLEQDIQAQTALWEETEADVEALIGGVRRPSAPKAQ